MFFLIMSIASSAMAYMNYSQERFAMFYLYVGSSASFWLLFFASLVFRAINTPPPPPNWYDDVHTMD